MQHRNRFIHKTREGRRLLTSDVYITKQKECVAVYSKRRVYYRMIKTERMRQFTENGAYHRNGAMLKPARYYSKRWITEPMINEVMTNLARNIYSGAYRTAF